MNVCEEVFKKIREGKFLLLSPFQRAIVASLEARGVKKDINLIDIVVDLKPYYHRKYKSMTPSNLLVKKHNQIYAARREINDRIQAKATFKDCFYVAIGDIPRSFKLLVYPASFAKAKTRDKKLKERYKKRKFSTLPKHEEKEKNLSEYLKGDDFKEFEEEIGGGILKFDHIFDYKNPEFEEIKAIGNEERKKKCPEDKCFYDGIDCTWNHIYAEQDVKRQAWVSRVFRNLAGKYRHCFIRGDLGQGKSTLIKRMAYNYHEIFEVLEMNEFIELTSENLIFVTSILKILNGKSKKRILLLAENLLQQSKWEMLLEKILDLEKVYLIATSRDSDWHIVEKSTKFIGKIVSIHLDLDYVSARDIYNYLKDKNRVTNKEDLLKLYAKSEKHLLEFLYLVCQEIRLEVSSKKEIESLPPDAQDVLRYIATSHFYFGTSLSVTLLESLTSLDYFRISKALASLTGNLIKKTANGYLGIHELRSKVATEIIHQHLPLESTIVKIIIKVSGIEELTLHSKIENFPLVHFVKELQYVLDLSKISKMFTWCAEPVSEKEMDYIVEKVATRKNIEDMASIISCCEKNIVRQEIKEKLLAAIFPEVVSYFGRVKLGHQEEGKFFSYANIVLMLFGKMGREENCMNLLGILQEHPLVKEAIYGLNHKRWQDYLQDHGFSKGREYFNPLVGEVMTFFLILFEKKAISSSIIEEIIKQTEMVYNESMVSTELASAWCIREVVLSKETLSTFNSILFKNLKQSLASVTDREKKEDIVWDISMFHKTLASKLCKVLNLRLRDKTNRFFNRIDLDGEMRKGSEKLLFKIYITAAEKSFVTSVPLSVLQKQLENYKEWQATGWQKTFKKKKTAYKLAVTRIEEEKFSIEEIPKLDQVFVEYYKYAGAAKWWKALEETRKFLLKPQRLESTLETDFSTRLELCIAMVKHFTDETDYSAYVRKISGEENWQSFKEFYDSIINKELLVEKYKVDYPDLFR